MMHGWAGSDGGGGGGGGGVTDSSQEDSDGHPAEWHRMEYSPGKPWLSIPEKAGKCQGAEATVTEGVAL